MITRNFTQFIYLLMVWLIVAQVQSAYSVTPLFRADFDQATLADNGWMAIPNGQGEFALASVSIGTIPTQPGDSTITDGRGVIVTAQRGQGALVLGPLVEIGDDPVILRVSVKASSGGAVLAHGALDAPRGGSIADIDNSGNFFFDSDSASVVNGYQRFTTVYRSKRGAVIPLFQAAVDHEAAVSSVTFYFDRFEIIPLNESTVADSALLAALGGRADLPAPTPTPTPPPPTPTPDPQADYSIRHFLEISPLDDGKQAFAPDVAHDRQSRFVTVAADRAGGFQDILLREFDNSTGVLSDPVTVNQTFEDTVANSPALTVDFGGVRHIAWSDNRSLDKLFSVFLTAVDAFGQRFLTQDILANRLYEETNAVRPALAVQNNGDVVVTWQDDRNFLVDIFARRFRWDGSNYQTVDDLDFIVNRTFENTNTGDPAVAMNGDGGIVVAWSDNRAIIGDYKRNDIHARFFTMSTRPDDTPQLPADVLEVRVNEPGDILEQSTRPRVAYSNGRYLIVWESYNPGTGGKSIRAALLDRDGEILVPEFLVDSGEDANRAHSPSVAVWSKDRFLITWADDAYDSLDALFYDAAENMYLTYPIELLTEVFGVSQTRLAVGDGNHAVLVWEETIGGMREASGLSLQVNAADLRPLGAPTLASERGSIPGVKPMSQSEREEETRGVIRDQRFPKLMDASPQR